MLTVGSLFSGIGGFDLGLERAGYEIIWQVENNEFCRQVLKKHWPAVPCHYDIKSIDWDWLPRVDLVCGGFPCQPFSCAGKQRGAADDRYLWPEVVRCLATVRPTWFLGENVPGLLHLGIDQVLADLEALGYQTAVLGIPAAAVDAPHIRQRLWIVAHTGKHSARRSLNGSNHGQQSDVTNDWKENARYRPELCSEAMADTALNGQSWSGSTWPRGHGFENSYKKARGSSWWATEPQLGRVAYGVSHRVDRLRGLGNAVVPAIVEAIGRMILDVEQAHKNSANLAQRQESTRSSLDNGTSFV